MRRERPVGLSLHNSTAYTSTIDPTHLGGCTVSHSGKTVAVLKARLFQGRIGCKVPWPEAIASGTPAATASGLADKDGVSSNAEHAVTARDPDVDVGELTVQENLMASDSKLSASGTTDRNEGCHTAIGSSRTGPT